MENDIILQHYIAKGHFAITPRVEVCARNIKDQAVVTLDLLSTRVRARGPNVQNLANRYAVDPSEWITPNVV